jgi:hypothetical protein
MHLPVHRAARVTAVLVIAASLHALHGPPASADGGCGAPGRPACTLLRPTESDSRPDAPFGAGDCVVLIGGLGSSAESTALALDPLLARADGVTVTTLAYDSLGRIGPAARALRDHVERISPSCGAIHLIAHSMGGVVADRAFSLGLSVRDRIATYIPLASPHNGSTIARALCGVGGIDAGYVELLRRIAELLGQPDPSSAAICDLAMVGPAREPRGVATARLRLVTDPLVPRRDHLAPHRDVRELLPVEPEELEGHGGILRSAQARRVVERALADRAVPADDRDLAQREAATLASAVADAPLAGIHEAIGGALRAGAVVAGLAARLRDLIVPW